MKKKFFTIALGALTLGACSSDLDSPEDPNICPVERVELTRAQEDYVGKSSEFAFRLAEKVATSNADKDVLLSPISAAYVLGMIENGADGETKRQIATALGFGDGDDEALNDFFHRLIVGAPRVDRSVKIAIANAIMADKGFPLKADFVNTVSNHYLASVENYDFRLTDMMEKVNNWAREHTEGMIEKILDQKVDENVCMFAMNAVYFQGNWAKAFDENATSKADFTDESGNVSKVDMMHLENYLGYGECADYTFVTIPYSNGGWSMNVLLPNEGKTVGDVMASLSKGSWQQASMTAGKQEVRLSLPKFEIETGVCLNDMLKELGIVDAFVENQANFSRLSDRHAFLSSVQQKAKIEVNESGTKAAAVTVAQFGCLYYVPSSVVYFNADRPFVFMITENTTGTVYFIGVKRK